MHFSSTSQWVRSLTVTVVLTGAPAVAAWWCARGVAGHLATTGLAAAADGPATVDDVLVLVTLSASAVLSALIALAAGRGCLAGLTGPRRAGGPLGRTTVPATSRRRTAGSAAGGAISALACAAVLWAAAPATAAPLPHTGAVIVSTSTGTGTGTPVADNVVPVAGTRAAEGYATAVPGWTPGIATVTATAAPLATGPAGAADRTTRAAHVVIRGDTLWDIAAADLEPGATAAQIAAHWPRWWQANHDVIGDDPDVLHAGQILLPPG